MRLIWHAEIWACLCGSVIFPWHVGLSSASMVERSVLSAEGVWCNVGHLDGVKITRFIDPCFWLCAQQAKGIIVYLPKSHYKHITFMNCYLVNFQLSFWPDCWRCLVVLHPHHYLFLHCKLGCLSDCGEDGISYRERRGFGQADWDCLWNTGCGLHKRILPGEKQRLQH